MSDTSKDKSAIEKLGEALMKSFEKHGELYPVEQLTQSDYPLQIADLQLQRKRREGRSDAIFGHLKGKPIAVRLAKDERTRVGIFLGELISEASVAYSKKSETLFVAERTNPAIWVPSLSRIVWGMESWWRPIENVEQFDEITDKEKALREQLEVDLERCDECSAPLSKSDIDGGRCSSCGTMISFPTEDGRGKDR